MIDKSKQYNTRGGREVRIYATDGAGIFPVHGAIKHVEGWSSFTWANNGSSVNSATSKENPNDLIEIKPRIKIERWVMVNRNGDYSLWLDKPSKSVSVDAFAITRISFEVEEGEGLDAV